MIAHPNQVRAVTGRIPRKPAKTAKPVKDPQPDRTRPQEHRGLAIVREVLTSNLPSGAPFKITKLELDDGTTAHGCLDCLFTGDTVTDLRHHRNDEHGTAYGKRRPKVTWEKDPDLSDLVLPPRGDQPAPTNPMEMTLAEFLSLAPSYAALGDLTDRLERERDAALNKVAELTAQFKDAQHAVAVYPTLQQEVVDLRLMVRNAGTYEELKTEVLSLRAFKKKITAKLESLGFNYADEEPKEQ